MSRLVTYAWLHGQNPCFHRAGGFVMKTRSAVRTFYTSHYFLPPGILNTLVNISTCLIA